MKPTKEEFKKLQKEWYQRLSDQGFDDIEKIRNDHVVLIKSSSYSYRDMDAICREAKEQYFILLEQKSKDVSTQFRNDIDKHIMIRHSEGAHINTIVRELDALQMPRERKSIRIIIRRYEMAWNIRCYTKKQLNVKTNG